MLIFIGRFLGNFIHAPTNIEEEKEKNAVITGLGIYKLLMEEFRAHVENLMVEII